MIKGTRFSIVCFILLVLLTTQTAFTQARWKGTVAVEEA